MNYIYQHELYISRAHQHEFLYLILKMNSIIFNWIQLGNDLHQKYKIWRFDNDKIISSIESNIELPKQIQNIDWDIVFYDIETYQNDTSKIILPQNDEFLNMCEVRLICAYSCYKNTITKYVYTLMNLKDNITESEGVTYYYSNNPSVQFLDHLRSKSNSRPTMLVGYNSSSGSEHDIYPGYDLPAILISSAYKPQIIYTYSRLGTRIRKNILMFDNVFVLDMLMMTKYCNSNKSEFLVSSGLDGLARIYGTEGKNHISIQDLNNGLCGNNISIVIEYCLQDVNICYEVFNLMKIMEYFNEYIVDYKISPLTVLKGKQAQVLFALDSIKNENHSWSLVSSDISNDNTYRNIKTNHNVSGLHELISVSQFRLFSSTCIEYNICYSTFVGFENEIQLGSDVYKVPHVYKGLTACFHKNYIGHIPTVLSRCDKLSSRTSSTSQTSITGLTNINLVNNITKVLVSNKYKLFPYYRNYIAYSVTSAVRITQNVMKSIYNDLHIKVVLYDNNCSYVIAKPNCTLKNETEVIISINSKLITYGFNHLRMIGQLDNSKRKILVGKNNQHMIMNNTLECIGYVYSTNSPEYNNLVIKLLKVILTSYDRYECISELTRFRSELYNLYNNNLYYVSRVKNTDKYDVTPLTSYVKWLPSNSGIRITRFNTDEAEHVVEHFYKNLVCNYLGCQDNSRTKCYKSDMCVEDLWNMISN